MKRLFAVLCVLCAAPLLLAATVTLQGTSGNTCPFSSSTSDRAGNITYHCVGVAVVTPQPAPAPAPTPREPVAAPTPPSSGCQIQNDLILGPSSVIQRRVFETEKTYSVRLPPVSAEGAFDHSDHPQTPQHFETELYISVCPGDIESAKRVVMPGPRGGIVATPCYTKGSRDGGGVIRWSHSGSFSHCPITNGYLNLRVVRDGGIVDYRIVLN